MKTKSHHYRHVYFNLGNIILFVLLTLNNPTKRYSVVPSYQINIRPNSASQCRTKIEFVSNSSLRLKSLLNIVIVEPTQNYVN